MKRLIRVALTGVTAAILAACGGGSSPPADEFQPLATTNRGATASSLAIEGGIAQNALDARLLRASGPQRVWVTLSEPSLAAFKATQLEALGMDMQSRTLGGKTDARALSVTEQAQRSALSTHRGSLRARQDELMNQLRGMGAQELGRVHVAHNAVAIRVDASSLKAISQLSGVLKVRPVVDYQLDLSETVPYIGGAAAQAAGRTGAGVKVAVLDSGIDYTHKNLGGAGTAAAYAAAYGSGPSDPLNKTLDGLFPTAKVVGGYDFVGEEWPNSPEAPDPDPIDYEGHGTHVADIIAGKSLDGTRKGVAPGASLLAVKVCSAVASSCSGVALLQGMDFALDPNGDGDTSDAVDVINMSLGSSYGQIEDDLTLATFNAVKLGTLVVASAGNSADKPYVTGSPSTAVGAISVAQTQVPSAKAIALTINSPAAIAGTISNTATVDWAPITAGFSGEVKLASATGAANNLACTALAAGSLAGKVALIDRGTCSISVKVHNAAVAGAAGVLVANNAGGDPPTFSFGGPDPFTAAQTLIITQSDGARIKANAAAPVIVSVSPSVSVPLVGGVVASSSRGPSYSTQHIKPEIGAPGASLSAEVGTGDGQTAFGGTSGAAPMVAGAAALLVEAFPRFSPEKIKALLMNSAETAVFTSPAALPGQLAPITRIGAGEVRVDRALAMTSLAWNQAQKSAALSFGALEVERQITTTDQKIRIENLSNSSKTYTITPTFRYASDEASGAVKVVAPAQVVVAARGFKDINVRLTIDPAKLPSWSLNGGSLGGTGAALNGPEFDGYLLLKAGSEQLSLPWHVLPRRAAATASQWVSKRGSNLSLYLNNTGWELGQYELFSLLATSPKLPAADLPNPGDNFAVVDIRAVGARYLAEDICGFPGGCVEFAINTHGRRSHPAYPGGFEVDIDTNGDGIADYFVYNSENGGFAATGQTVIVVQNAATGSAAAYYFADADLNSGNMTMTAPLAALGVTAGTTLNFDVLAYDNYFSGIVTDFAAGLRFTPGAARFNAVGLPFGDVPSKTGGKIGVSRATVDDSKSSESGVLILHRRNKVEADVLPLN